jgi:hypothetical protein
MKIVVRTPTELLIRDSAIVLRAFGVFLGALGAFAIWLGLTQDPDGRIATVPIPRALPDARYRRSRVIMAIIGSATNGMCPNNWIHQR